MKENIKYRNCWIRLTEHACAPRWEWAHDDYDGAPDAYDQRHGLGETVDECVLQIEEILDADEILC